MAHTRRVRRIATWLALAGSLGVAILFVAVRAGTPSDGARVAFYGDAWSAVGVQIAPIDEPAPGLEGGDTVVEPSTTVRLRPGFDDAANPSVARPTADVPIPYRLIASRSAADDRRHLGRAVDRLGPCSTAGA